jgi:hypothetical protein
MRHAILFGPLVYIVLSLGCQTTPDPMLVRQRIAITKSWHLALTSNLDPADIAPPKKRSLLVNLTGQALKQTYGVALTEDTLSASGEIRIIITADSFNSAVKSIDVALYDVGRQLITRSAVWNSKEQEMSTFGNSQPDVRKFNENIADRIAKKTADLLREGRVTAQ